MAKTKAKTSAADRFGAVVTKHRGVLTPTERKAKGLLLALRDCQRAAERALAAADQQAKIAAQYQKEAKELEAKLAKLPAE